MHEQEVVFAVLGMLLGAQLAPMWAGGGGGMYLLEVCTYGKLVRAFINIG